MPSTKLKTSCGFIINTPQGWLICHSTGNPHWDFPKGVADVDEAHLDAALRETIEETGLNLTEHAHRAIDLGCFHYSKQKEVHLYLLHYDLPIDLSKLVCTSMVDRVTYQYPEVDEYMFAQPADALQKLSKSMGVWLKANVPHLL